MNKQKTICGKNTMPGLLLCVLAWLFAGQSAPAQNNWTFDKGKFDNYMTINAYVVLDGAEVESAQFEIAAFVGEECRGACTLKPQTFMGHNYPCFLPVWGAASETGQAVTIKVYDHSTDTEYEADEKPSYRYNGNLGGFDDDGNTVPLYQLTINTDPNTLVYDLTILPSENGSVSADVTSGLPGTVITLTLTPATGYEPDAVSAYKTDESTTTVSLSGTGNTRTLAMPVHNITVEASFKKTADLLAVEAAAALIAAGSYTAPQEYAENEPALKAWLVETINSLPGMSATGITLTAGNINLTAFTAAIAGTKNSESGTNGSFRFTVSLSLGEVQQTTAEKSGVITAEVYVEPDKWAVTIAPLSNGTVTASPDVAETGETITLTIAPTTGYELKSVSAYKTGEPNTTVALFGAGLSRAFTMPAYPVTVSAVFGKTQATLDAEAIATAVSLIENATYSFLQSGGNTEEDIIRQLVAQINDLLSVTGITVTADDITLSNFTPAVAGSAGSPGGTDGGFSFSVNLHKNSINDTTGGISGVIAATLFTAIGDISQEKGLKASVQNGVLYIGGLTQGKVWSVYNISGALVYGGIAGGDKAEVHLQNRGVYIVKSGNSAIKVAY
jgi:hypothetical protein